MRTLSFSPLKLFERLKPPTHAYTIFTRDGQRYGIESDHVSAVRMWMEPVQNAQSSIRGYVEHMGQRVPVYHLEGAEYGGPRLLSTQYRVLVIADYGQMIGVLVDAVEEQIEVADIDISPAPYDGFIHGHHNVCGFIENDRDMLVLLDPAALIRDKLEATE